MLILKFLYSVLDNDDADALFKLKEKFLTPRDRDYLTFTQDFFALHKKLPARTTLEGKFGIVLHKNTEPADFWLKEIQMSFQKSVIESAIIESAKTRGDSKKALEIFQQAIVEHNTDMEIEVHSYKDGAQRLKNYSERKIHKGITYLSTGMLELDVMSMGYKKADLWTIGGRESIGKTWQLLKMANALDITMLTNKNDRPILIVSGEMTAEELEERLDSIRCAISYARLSSGDLKKGEEMKYQRYLAGFNSNIIIIDSFDGVEDIEYFITLYRPACIFVDGSHLLAKSYDWKDVAHVTKTMKTITRNNKVPIVNTTHLKAERGTSAKGGDLDDFAYSKGYTRDSDIVGVMFASDIMELDNQVGIDWVKVRRGNRSRNVWQSDYDNSTTTLVENLTGKELASAKLGDEGTTADKGTYKQKQVEVY